MYSLVLASARFSYLTRISEDRRINTQGMPRSVEYSCVSLQRLRKKKLVEEYDRYHRFLHLSKYAVSAKSRAFAGKKPQYTIPNWMTSASGADHPYHAPLE